MHDGVAVDSPFAKPLAYKSDSALWRNRPGRASLSLGVTELAQAQAERAY
jgi:hypothetical protein